MAGAGQASGACRGLQMGRPIIKISKMADSNTFLEIYLRPDLEDGMVNIRPMRHDLNQSVNVTIVLISQSLETTKFFKLSRYANQGSQQNAFHEKATFCVR